MLLMIVMICLPTLILLILSILNKMISKTLSSENEKMTNFECGFDLLNMTIQPFSMHFFLIMIIFLIFDVEFMLILPLIFAILNNFFMVWFKLMIFFFFILILGLYMEWYNYLLNWY